MDFHLLTIISLHLEVVCQFSFGDVSLHAVEFYSILPKVQWLFLTSSSCGWFILTVFSLWLSHAGLVLLWFVLFYRVFLLLAHDGLVLLWLVHFYRVLLWLAHVGLVLLWLVHFDHVLLWLAHAGLVLLWLVRFDCVLLRLAYVADLSSCGWFVLIVLSCDWLGPLNSFGCSLPRESLSFFWMVQEIFNWGACFLNEEPGCCQHF